ncbi:hypothetical protein DESAMIL20_1799 [Desulfurella amilsii]|uniref:Cardiolipin synthase N-terminal domain-containing protein n=1 Tax=Desulfurella amilsii TaxID=1562698 RepID=A0A1X4XXI5_9BACT|nr:PLD nuclease N-terminal domain-containing protein [Desulfurella amilsii]OSS42246.1 hypothetical protein DESAMIL20_1799 [Desulfurella amilsii]
MGLFKGFLFFGLLSIIIAILWLMALIDILKSDFKDGLTKVIWLVFVIFLPFLGSILYFFIGRDQKLKND